MNTALKKMTPFLLILLGLFVLLLMGNVIVTGVCFLFGIVMVLERIWPEKWEADKNKKQELL